LKNARRKRSILQQPFKDTQKEMNPILKALLNFKPLVYINLLFATAALTYKALRKVFFNGTSISKIVSLV